MWLETQLKSDRHLAVLFWTTGGVFASKSPLGERVQSYWWTGMARGKNSAKSSAKKIKIHSLFVYTYIHNMQNTMSLWTLQHHDKVCHAHAIRACPITGSYKCQIRVKYFGNRCRECVLICPLCSTDQHSHLFCSLRTFWLFCLIALVQTTLNLSSDYCSVKVHRCHHVFIH